MITYLNEINKMFNVTEWYIELNVYIEFNVYIELNVYNWVEC